MKASLRTRQYSGFTIVELLIVIVVIAILAAIVVVSYTGISQRAKQSAAASSAESAAKKALSYATLNTDQLPSDLPTAGVNNDTNTTYEYSYDNTAKTYCITATFQKVSYYVSSTNSTAVAGLCPGHTGGAPLADGAIMQTITTATCPSSRIRAVDARDNHTYWVQKLVDGKCWMLTNLSYTGGGTNTYNDTKTLSGTSSYTYTSPIYFNAGNVNATVEPTAPSTSTDGGATNPQYGYLYNYCAAMGGQATAACANAATPAQDATITICPAGWRLPTGNGGEWGTLNSVLNGGSTTSDTGFFPVFMSQRSGYWNGSFLGTGSYSRYWASTVASAQYGFTMYFYSTSVFTADTSYKPNAMAVRCVAN